MKHLYTILLIMLFSGITSITYAEEGATAPAVQEGSTAEGTTEKKGEEEPECD